MSDPAKYRTKEELEERKNNDPIEQVKQMLIKDQKMAEEDVKAIDKEVREIIKEAAEFSQESPEPDPKELWTDVLVSAGGK